MSTLNVCKLWVFKANKYLGRDLNFNYQFKINFFLTWTYEFGGMSHPGFLLFIN